MRNNIILIALTFSFTMANAQDFKERTNKGRIYASYGVNRTAYDLSTLRMAGTGYDFSLTHFDANDGVETVDFGNFNAKLGFFISEKISISVGYDNFSYKNIDDRLVKIDGTIDAGDYAATYFQQLDVIRTDKDFLQYGYNKLSYINLNLEINDDFWVSKSGKLAWSYYFGLGGGILMSESETLLFASDKATISGTPPNEVITQANPVVTNNGMSGFGGNASFGTRLHLGPVFLDLGGKAGYMRTDDVAVDADGGLANHTFIFASGIASVGLSFNLSK